MIETAFTMVWFVCGVMFYSFTIGNLASLIASVDVRAEYLKQRIGVLNDFVRRNNMPSTIENSVKRYVENNANEELQ